MEISAKQSNRSVLLVGFFPLKKLSQSAETPQTFGSETSDASVFLACCELTLSQALPVSWAQSRHGDLHVSRVLLLTTLPSFNLKKK